LAANETPGAKLAASFSPKLLGQPTTISFSLSIDPPSTFAPPPVSTVEVHYPSTLGFATSGLGVAECNPVSLEALGAEACPANSKMGSGGATVAVAFGADVVNEHVSLSLFAAPSDDGFVHLAVLATGTEPIDARIVISAVLLAGRLQITVPPTPSVPGAEDVSLSSLHVTLGGPLTYYSVVHGHRVPYRPRGVGLPDACPHSGWRFGANLAFANGAHSSADAVVRCPRRARA
jgi:hypothetical protein